MCGIDTGSSPPYVQPPDSEDGRLPSTPVKDGGHGVRVSRVGYLRQCDLLRVRQGLRLRPKFQRCFRSGYATPLGCPPVCRRPAIFPRCLVACWVREPHPRSALAPVLILSSSVRVLPVTSWQLSLCGSTVHTAHSSPPSSPQSAVQHAFTCSCCTCGHLHIARLFRCH